jgi:hypothetical protein
MIEVAIEEGITGLNPRNITTYEFMPITKSRVRPCLRINFVSGETMTLTGSCAETVTQALGRYVA